MHGKGIEICFRDYWFKIVEFLQQNWGLVDQAPHGAGCTVYFFGDTAGVFDRLSFASVSDAEAALRRNGFARYAERPDVHDFIRCPEPPFREQDHPNGPIYSSGRSWR